MTGAGETGSWWTAGDDSFEGLRVEGGRGVGVAVERVGHPDVRRTAGRGHRRRRPGGTVRREPEVPPRDGRGARGTVSSWSSTAVACSRRSPSIRPGGTGLHVGDGGRPELHSCTLSHSGGPAVARRGRRGRAGRDRDLRGAGRGRAGRQARNGRLTAPDPRLPSCRRRVGRRLDGQRVGVRDQRVRRRRHRRALQRQRDHPGLPRPRQHGRRAPADDAPERLEIVRSSAAETARPDTGSGGLTRWDGDGWRGDGVEAMEATEAAPPSPRTPAEPSRDEPRPRAAKTNRSGPAATAGHGALADLLERAGRPGRPGRGQAGGRDPRTAAPDGRAPRRGRPAGAAAVAAPGLHRLARHRQDDRGAAVRRGSWPSSACIATGQLVEVGRPDLVAERRRRHRDEDRGAVRGGARRGAVHRRGVHAVRDGDRRPRLRPGGRRHAGQADGGPPRRGRGDRGRATRTRCASSWPPTPGWPRGSPARSSSPTTRADELVDDRRGAVPCARLPAGVRDPRGARHVLREHAARRRRSATAAARARCSRRWSAGRRTGSPRTPDVTPVEMTRLLPGGPRRRRRAPASARAPGPPTSTGSTRC